MNLEQLQALIAAGETLNVEFKGEGRAPLNDRDLVEAVACLANRAGREPAWLLLGVEDDGQIAGSRHRHGDITDPDRLAAMIANRTRPVLGVGISVLGVGGRTVVVIEVPAQLHAVGTSEGVFTRRARGGDGRPACIPMDALEIQSLQADRGQVDASAQVLASACWEDLDPLEFERYRRSIRERRGRSDESLLDFGDLDLAKALGVIEANGSVWGVRLAALLLFGKEDALRRLVPTHETAFQILRGIDVEVNDFFRWPLLRIMEEIEARIRVRNREQELMVGLLRVGVPDFSERALREAVANAQIHRDYQRNGAVHFQWHDDRIEISSPGGFPEGVTLANLLVTSPRPRNPLLADALKRAGIVERNARGIDTIYFEQLRNGRPAPSYDRSGATEVSVVIPGGEANLNFVQLLVREANDGRVLRLDELLVLNSLWRERSMTTEDVARLIQRSPYDARVTMGKLLEAGLAEERGQKKGRTWHLTAAVYRALGEKAAYVRQRGFEVLQQEQMVQQYVEKHGEITRGEAAELCRIGNPQAYRMLQLLVNKGVLTKIGTRGRGVKYVRARN